MAITLRHDTAGVGAPAVGGTDSKRKFGQALVLQQQQINQDNARRMEDRLFEMGRMRFDKQAQFVRDNRMIQADKDMFDARQKAENERFAEQRKLQQQDMEAQNQQNWMQQNTRNLEGQVAQIRGMMSQQQYTPEGQQLYGELAGALRVIEGQRDTIRPREYNQLLNQWLDKVERAGLDKFVAKPPTIEDTMSGNFKDLGTGYGVFLQPDGKMDVREIDPSKVAAAKNAGAGAGGVASISAADYFSDDSKYEAAKKKAMAMLEERHMRENPESTTAPVFSADAIHNEMLKSFNEQQGFLRQLMGSQTPAEPAPSQPTATSPVVAETPMPSPAAVSDSVSPAQLPEAPTEWGWQEGYIDRGMPKQPGALSPDGTEARKQLMAMPVRDRVEQLLQFHPDAKGRTLAQMLEDPVAKEEYQRNVSQGLMEPGKYEEYALQILDDQLTYDLGILSGKDAAPGLGAGDIKDPAVKGKLESLPQPKSLAEAKAVEGEYFIDPEGNMRMIPPSRR